MEASLFWERLSEVPASLAALPPWMLKYDYEGFDLPALESARREVQEHLSRLDAEIAQRKNR